MHRLRIFFRVCILFCVRVRTQTSAHIHILAKRLAELIGSFFLGFPRRLDCFRKHRIGGSCSLLSFLVRWKKCFRNYGDRFNVRNDIENLGIAYDRKKGLSRSIGDPGGMGDESWLYGLRTDGGVVFDHSGRWIVRGMRGQKDRNGLLGSFWPSSVWMNRWE